MKAQMKAQVKTHKLRNTFFLFLTAMIWGAAFVAQSVSMDYIGPFTFICLRSVIGGLFLIPVIIVLDGIRKKSQNESADVVNSENILRDGGETKTKLEKQTAYRRWHCLWYFFVFCQLFSADRNSVYDSRKSWIYHNILYHYRTSYRFVL